jgi:hypothetical protein
MTPGGPMGASTVTRMRVWTSGVSGSIEIYFKRAGTN